PTNDGGTLTFQAVSSGDATLGIDAVNIVQRDTNNVVIMNPSFEASGPPTASTGNPPAADSGEIIAPAAMAGWGWDTNQSGTYGISLVGGVYADNGAIPEQDLVGFISGPGSLSQSVTLVANSTYQLSFAYNAQSAPGTNAHLQVKFGGVVIDDESVAPVGGSNPYHTKTVSFTATGPGGVLTFAQTNANATLLLDNIRLVGKVASQVPIEIAPLALDLAPGQTAQIQVTVPAAYLAVSSADVNVVSGSSTVVQIAGAGANGVLTLHYPQGGANVQSFQVVGVGKGSAGISVTPSIGLQVVYAPTVSVFTSFVINPSFEDSAAGVTPIAAWTGGTAVETVSGPNYDNGILPDRKQVAVLQGTNTLSQQIYGFTPGENYWLQFRYNASTAGGTYPAVDLEVKVGGKLLVTITNITAVGTSVGDYAFYFTNIVFVPTNASELLEFDTTPTVPKTTPALLLDAVSMVQRDTNEVVIENPSFEAGGESSTWPGYLQPQPIDGWLITGSYGLNGRPAGPFEDNGATPDQGEVLFMQGSCTASNEISGPLNVGQVYTLSYGANLRTAAAGASMTYDVGFGDIPLLVGQPITPVGDDNPFVTMYFVFTNDAPGNVLGFATHPTGDVTLLLDDVHLAPGNRIPPQLVSESPAPGENSVLQPTLQFFITQGSYALDMNTLQLWLNGTNVAASATVTPTNNPTGILISYAYPLLPAGTNSVQLILSDKNSPPMMIDKTYTFVTLALPTLNPALATVPGSANTNQPGFRCRMVQTATQNENTDAQAEIMLAGGELPDLADETLATDNGYFDVTGVINYDGAINAGLAGGAGNFQASNGSPDAPFPGLPGTTGSTGDTAAEWLTFVAFPQAGPYWMGVNSDDGFRVSEATNQDYPVYLVSVKAPANLATNLLGTEAGFSPALPQLAAIGPVSGQLVVTQPPDDSSAITNASALKGNIALIDRGAVSFQQMVTNVSQAGAIGLIVADQQTSPDRIVTMGGSGTGLTIPAVEINYSSGQVLHSAYASGTAVTVTLQSHSYTNLGFVNAGRAAADTWFGFNVPAAGVYPLRLIWFNGNGEVSAGNLLSLEWFSMDRNGNRILLNDTSNPQALMAYRARANVPLALPPTLSFSLSAGKVTLAWPVSATGFVLLETSALPGGWTNSTATVTVQGSQNVVDITPVGKSKFYRLAQ
ncbi:MAG: PA domain-containing protein, partial [Verrucomicrobiota bacterium]